MDINYKLALRYGVIGGIIMSILVILTYIFYVQIYSGFMGMILVGLAYLAVTIFVPIWAGILYRRAKNRSLDFSEAFVAVLTTYALTAFISLFVSFLIAGVLDTEYPQKMNDLLKRTVSDFMERKGATDEDIQKRQAEMEDQKFPTDAPSLLKSFGSSMIFGAILSLIIALFVKRPDKKILPVTEEGNPPSPQT